MIEIYALADPRDGIVRYIGKAKDAQKRLKGHLENIRRGHSPFKSWLRELRSLRLKPQMSILVCCPDSDWVQHEQAEIARERAVNSRLLNIARGGDQPGEPTDPRLYRMWQAKKRFMQLMPRNLSEEAKARLRARIGAR